ncbi:hypothetical protein CUMW_234690 [Citrus unshiu]|uniref:Uncharacterized protein n=1 Tax=Citrus unshiu TaxID=55188 RepID=A0A2H5QIY6_CITUN|nr:hypothetical protein CUMW_234690 [Citrus unshiu]
MQAVSAKFLASWPTTTNKLNFLALSGRTYNNLIPKKWNKNKQSQQTLYDPILFLLEPTTSHLYSQELLIENIMVMKFMKLAAIWVGESVLQESIKSPIKTTQIKSKKFMKVLLLTKGPFRLATSKEKRLSLLSSSQGGAVLHKNTFC